MFPGDLLPSTHYDTANPTRILARSEFDRRIRYTNLLERNLLGGRQYALFGLVKECLSNAPKIRPLTSHLLSTLEEMTEMDVGYLHRVKAIVKEKKLANLEVRMCAV